MAPPVKWRLGDGSVQQAVESIGDKSRLKIPSTFLEGIGRELLGHLDVRGRIRLLAWTPYGEAVEAALARIAKGAPSATTLTQEALDLWAPAADIVDRFHQLRVGSDGRVGLSREARYHLEAEEGDEVLVWRFPGWMEVWTWAYRNRRLKTVPVELAALPWPAAD